MSAVIEVEGLEKRYGQNWAVRGASFSVDDGEIFGILGSNGAGKTTTVECLQGLRSADGGHMRVLGADPHGSDAARHRVGSQLQDAALPDRIRVREALELFAGPGAVPIGDLLDTWGLGDHRRKAFADLSGGLKQRLFIALALLNRPEVVFFDELTQGLDPVARREVWKVIESVRDQGATVVLVTHFMEEAERLCDRLAIFDAGHVIAQGTPEQIIADHAESASVSFTPNRETPGIERCPGVRHISSLDGRTLIEGSPDMVAYVCAELVRQGPPPTDLRIVQPNLEDAVLAIEDRSRA